MWLKAAHISQLSSNNLFFFQKADILRKLWQQVTTVCTSRLANVHVSLGKGANAKIEQLGF